MKSSILKRIETLEKLISYTPDKLYLMLSNNKIKAIIGKKKEYVYSFNDVSEAMKWIESTVMKYKDQLGNSTLSYCIDNIMELCPFKYDLPDDFKGKDIIPDANIITNFHDLIIKGWSLPHILLAATINVQLVKRTMYDVLQENNMLGLVLNDEALCFYCTLYYNLLDRDVEKFETLLSAGAI